MASTKSGSSRIGFALKLAVSAGLLTWVFARVDWPEFLAVLSRAEPAYIALYFLIGPLMLLTSTGKWKLLLDAKRLHFGIGRLYPLYFIGHFFNHLMPSNVGGDAVRTYKLGRETGRFGEVLASVFTERMTGLTVLLTLVLLSVASNASLLGESKVKAAVAFVFAAYAVLVWLVLDSRLVAFAARLDLPLLRTVMPKLVSVHEAVLSYRETPGVWLPVFGVSTLFYGLVMLNAYVGCLGFGAQPPPLAIAAAVPVILVITMIPISVGSLGLLEWAYFAIFEILGLSGPLGLSVALLNRASGILMGGLGGLFYARSLVGGEKREDYVVSAAKEMG